MVRTGVLIGVALAMLVVSGDAQAAGLLWEWKRCASGDASEGIDACTAIIDLGRKHVSEKHMAEAYTYRGNGYADLGKTDEAIADFTHAIDRDPTRDDAFMGRALQYYKLGDYKRAVVDFDAAIRLNPGEAVDWAWRGKAKGHLGDANGANADMAHAYQLDPQVEDDMKGTE